MNGKWKRSVLKSKSCTTIRGRRHDFRFKLNLNFAFLPSRRRAAVEKQNETTNTIKYRHFLTTLVFLFSVQLSQKKVKSFLTDGSCSSGGIDKYYAGELKSFNWFLFSRERELSRNKSRDNIAARRWCTNFESWFSLLNALPHDLNCRHFRSRGRFLSPL